MIHVLDPYFRESPRPSRMAVDTIVLHATAGASLKGDIAALRAKGYGYHYLIDRDGTIYKGAKTSSSVAHAGKSLGPQGEGCNRYSIGVAFCNRNDHIEKITDAQIEACRELLEELKQLGSIRWLTTHRLITMDPVRKGRSRKVDPRGVDMRLLATDAGLTLWEPWQGAADLPY